MDPKEKINEAKEFEMSFDDLDTAKAKAEAEARGETVDEEKPKVEKPAAKPEDTEEEDGEEKKSDHQDKSKETKKEDEAPANEEPKTVPKNNFPKKNEGESDAAYNLRVQLEVAKQGRDQAGTEEEKSVYEQRMDDLRKNLAEVNKDKKKSEPEKASAEDEDDNIASKITEAELKKLGFLKKEEVETVFQERLNELKKNEIIDSHNTAIKEFYKTRPEFLQNKDARNFLEKEVIDLIKPDLNTTPAQLFNALKLVSDAKFPKPNKSEAAKRSQEKVDAMNIEGNSKGTQKKSSVGNTENDLLRSMGWTDDQISAFG